MFNCCKNTKKTGYDPHLHNEHLRAQGIFRKKPKIVFADGSSPKEYEIKPSANDPYYEKEPPFAYKTPHPVNVKRRVGVAIAFLAVAVIALVIAYFAAPHSSFHSFVNHTFSQIKNGKMTLNQALLYIGLPIEGVAVIIGIALYVRKKHQAGESLKPTARQVKIAAVVAGALIVAGLIAFLILQYGLHSWTYNQAIPAIKNILNHKIMVWEGLAYVGGGTIGTIIVTAIAMHLINKYREVKTQRDETYFVE